MVLSHPESTKAIQGALRKALLWNQALLDGKASTLTELAEKENVAQRYICDLIKLAYDSTVQLTGKEPKDLTNDEWEEVRQKYPKAVEYLERALALQ